MLGRAFITLLEVQTLTVEIEGILNDLLVTYVSNDIQDDKPLPPSHMEGELRPFPIQLSMKKNYINYQSADWGQAQNNCFEIL